MIKLNDQRVKTFHFPDGTQKLNIIGNTIQNYICWFYENDEELVILIFICEHLNKLYPNSRKYLYMPYIPNARMDRTHNINEIFTLKYFSNVINSLEFNDVIVLDPHSNVSEGLIDHINVVSPAHFIQKSINKIDDENLSLFFPDEGSMKRYSGMVDRPYTFGIKKRDWDTGKIQGLDVLGNLDLIKGNNILIVDDICSRGGTFFHSAEKLKKLGAEDIYLYVSHCENTILEGGLLDCGLIKKVFTTNSIFTKENDLVEVFELCP